MGATAIYAINRIAQRREHGERIREDNFFSTSHRSAAEEIFEGCILAAKKSHEEMKLPYYGEFFASLAFDSAFGRSEANHLLMIAESLSYQQLALLSVFADPPMPLANRSFTGPPIPWATHVLLNETYGLSQRGLVQMWIVNRDEPQVLLDFPSVVPGRMRLTPLGKVIWNLMRLEDIPSDDRLKVAIALQ